MQETQIQCLGLEDLLEKGMATQSSIPIWRLPWAEALAGLQPKEVQSQMQLTLSHFTFILWARLNYEQHLPIQKHSRGSRDLTAKEA